MDPDRRKRLLIFVALICVGGWAADSLVVTPLIGVWQARSARIERLRQELEQSTSLLDRDSELKARWKDMKSRALSTRVSDAENAVFQSVSQWAGESRLSVTSVKPRWTQIAKNEPVLEIQLDATGDMGAVARFIYELESSALPLRVEDMGITSQDDHGGRLSLNLKLTGLVLKENEP